MDESRLRPAEGWSTLALLTLMLLTVGWAIEAADWSEGLHLLQFAILGAVLAGLVLAKIRRLPEGIAHFLALTLGAGWILVLGTTRLPETFTFGEQIRQIQIRFMDWIEVAAGQGVSADNLVFVLQMTFLLYLVAYISTWFLFKPHNVWAAVVPGGFAMLINVYYYYGDAFLTGYLILYLLSALLLIVRSNVYLQEREWDEAGIRYSSDIGFDFLQAGIIFSIIVLIVGWVTPAQVTTDRLAAVTWRLQEPWGQMQNHWNRVYAAVNYEARPGPAYFGDSLILSGPVPQNDQVVMDIATSKNYRYWRGTTYDRYTGRGWLNTDDQTAHFGTQQTGLPSVEFAARVPVTQTVRVYSPISRQVYASPRPLLINLPTRVQYSPIPASSGGSSDPGPMNVSMITSLRRMNEGETYTVVSSVSQADVQSLREAGTAYPTWVEDRYLQLPSSLPQRVRDLAQQITEGSDNNYDKASALESYLRQIEYNLRVPPPPPDRDPVDYFLFDSREGYCNYYASAFTTMARSLGIPARISAGYAQGEWIPEMEAYRVRQRHAHSWPEVFFPEYGWVTFEPTAARPLLVRPERASTEDRGDVQDPLSPEDRPNLPRDEEIILEDQDTPGALGDFSRFSTAWRSRFPAIVVSLAGLLVVIGAVGAAGWWFWFRGLSDLSFIETLFERMSRLARLMGLKQQPYQTPHEYGYSIAQALSRGYQEIRRITDLYVRERFSDKTLSDEEESQLKEAWLKLRRYMLTQLVQVRRMLSRNKK